MLSLLERYFNLYKNSQTVAYSLESWEKKANYRFLEEIVLCIKNDISFRLGGTYIHNK